MASAAGMMNGYVSSSTSSSSFGKLRKKEGNRGGDGRFRVSCVYTTASDPYKTLSIHPGASESEVRKAFRQLALKYHPDVCRGSNCGVQFHQINEAYDVSYLSVSISVFIISVRSISQWIHQIQSGNFYTEIKSDYY